MTCWLYIKRLIDRIFEIQEFIMVKENKKKQGSLPEAEASGSKKQSKSKKANKQNKQNNKAKKNNSKNY